MKSTFLPDGEAKARAAQQDAVRQFVAAKYADRLVAAGFFHRLIVRLSMRREIQRELKKIGPSPYTLWSQERM